MKPKLKPQIPQEICEEGGVLRRVKGVPDGGEDGALVRRAGEVLVDVYHQEAGHT